MKNHRPILLPMPCSLACLSSLALISQCHLLDQQSQVIFLRKLHSYNTEEIKGLLCFLASSLSFSPPSPFKAALLLDVSLWELAQLHAYRTYTKPWMDSDKSTALWGQFKPWRPFSQHPFSSLAGVSIWEMGPLLQAENTSAFCVCKLEQRLCLE